MIKGIVRDIIHPVVGRVLNHSSSLSPSWTPQYYVSNAGDDLKDGLSPLNAWRTIAKVNSISFVPGDKIGFAKNGVWAEKLIIPSSGSAGSPITFGAYGTGVNPLFNKTSSSGISIAARSDIVIQDIDLTNTGSGSGGANILGSGIWTRIIFQRMRLSSATDYNIMNTNNVITVTVNNVTMAASTAGERIRFTGAANSNITISNLTSTTGGTANQIDIQNCVNLTLNNVSVPGGGVSVALVAITGNLNLNNVTVSGASGTGIKLTSCTALLTVRGLIVTSLANGFWALNSTFGVGSTISNSIVSNTGSTPWRIDGSSNLEFISCTAMNGAASVGFYSLGAWANLVFTSCNSMGNSVDGFQFAGSGHGAVLTHCIADSNLCDGFSLIAGATVHDVTCLFCTAKNNGIKTDTSSGDGFTSHAATYNFNLYYCVAYGNTQSGMAMIETSHGVAYNCMFYNNGGAWNTLLGGGNLNTNRGGIYIGITGNNATTGTSWMVKNCITSSNYPVELKTLSVVNRNLITMDCNNYYHPIDANVVSLDNLVTFLDWITYHTTDGYEVNSIYGDPLFIDSVGGDFHLQTGSPAINAGVNVGLTQDYEGHAIDGVPDIGVYEKQ